MPRPKKTAISGEVGNIPVTRKRGNPDFSVSSFYIPKKLNLKFDRAILTLKAADFDVDRSDVLAGLISRFCEGVETAEKAMEDDGGLDLTTVLDAAGSGSVVDSAGMTLLKSQLKRSLDDAAALVEKYEAALKLKSESYDYVIQTLLQLVPEEHAEKIQASMAKLKRTDDPSWAKNWKEVSAGMDSPQG